MKKFYLLSLIFFSTFIAYGQTAPYVINENHNGCCGGNTNAGSSFKVFGAGQIDSIRIYPRHNQDYTATIKFYKGNGPNPDSLLYTQNFTVTGQYSTPSGNDVKLIRLTVPVKVKKDSVYTFYVEGTPIRFNNGFDTYSNGTYWNNSGLEDKSSDADFIIYIGTVTTTSVSYESLNNDILIQTSGDALYVIGSNKIFHLRLYNLNGSLISESSTNKMNLPALSESVYILQLVNDKEFYTRKIYIKQ